MSDVSDILPSVGSPAGIRRRPSTVIRVNDERFNIQSAQRRIVLRQLKKALLGQEVPAPLWAVLQLCDLEKIEYLVKLAHLSLKIMDPIADITCTLPFKWTKKAPGIQNGSLSSGGSSLNRRRGASPISRYAARERDGYKCVITGTRKVYETAQILPVTTDTSRLQDDPDMPSIWRFVDVFWGPKTAERWRKAAFNNPADPNLAVNDCSNLICLRRDLRSAWSNGLFALRPAWVADDQTEMELEFYWQPRASHKVFDMVDLAKEPQSTKNVNTVDRLIVVVGERGDPTYRPIESGFRFKLTTDDPVVRPLPSFDLLDMQWHFARLVALSAAANLFDDNEEEAEVSDDKKTKLSLTKQPVFTPDDDILAWVHSSFSTDPSLDESSNELMIGPLPGSEADRSRSVSKGSKCSPYSSGPVGSEESDSVIDVITGTGQLSIDFLGRD
ncbi:hypothetical protein N7457_001717 [Penicillium paradoxum]|uniref:uncharacterized protein n=1 Tax=Penicillium paradoxum TaxID=176176 RepID=UPI0025480F49|nr:uncharacterized protein N7457_001717 [Penicillium paradoxum]KAJ5795118.1 hypothetical protein N7457_001717 [Penicillium paradoxum]